MATYTCDAMASCMNTIGSYECSCYTGFEGDGVSCSGMLNCDGV